MPDLETQETDEQVEQQAEPKGLGVYEPFDWTPAEFVTLSEIGKNKLLELCRNCAKRDMAARRMEVEQAWEARLFKRGYQYLFPRRGGGWQLFSVATGRTWSQMQGAQVYETNIYGPYCEIITSALTRDVPTGKFDPVDPNSGPDVTAADKAETYKEFFAKNNDLKKLHTDAADRLCTDGRVLFYTSYVLDGQQFGFDDDEAETAVVPEDEAESEPLKPSRNPRGRTLVRCLGKLEHKVPIGVDDIHEMDFVQAHWDMHEAKAKAKFPWIEKQIKPGGGSVGEIGIDRIARINVKLALEGGYVTGDTFNREVTVTYTWLRPSAFYDLDEEVRQEFFDNFPDGLLAAHAGDALAFVRNEGMDDHLEIMNALPGDGQNRSALMSKVLSIQKRLNNWMDLLNDFFIRTVPTVWMDSEIFNVAALNKTTNTPGERKPFQSQPGRTMQEIVFEEPMPTHQPTLPEFIKLFFSDLPQMLSGALPSLFGEDTEQDTYRGLALQRASALGRLNTPWGRIQSAAAAYNRQAVMLDAKCRPARGESSISWTSDNGTTVTMELVDLKGNVLCSPEKDSNIPETADEKASRYQQALQEAPTNPLLQKIFMSPLNVRNAKDAAGYHDMDIPEADAAEKQIAEFEILLKKKPAPMPNPQVVSAQQQLQQAEQEAMAEGPEALAKFQEMQAQAMQAIQAMPPLISSYPVAQDASEDHGTEAQVCFWKMNSPEGRKLKNGTPEQQAAFQNMHLHWQEHTTMAQKLNPPQPVKPPSESVSMAVDKLPPELAAQAAQKFYGLNASPENFQEQTATETEQKITEKAADYGRTGTLQ